MKKITILFALICNLLSCTNNHTPKTIIDGFALGTTYHIVICEDTLEGTMALINQRFEHVNQSMSIYNPTSRLSKINSNQTDTLDQMLHDCISQAMLISQQTGGKYDVTIKPLTDAWGFATKQKTTDPNIDSLLQFVGYQKIQIRNKKIIKENPSIQIDLNSIAKGSTVDIIASALESLGHKNYLVEIGGEIFARGLNSLGQPWRVGIDKPIEGNITPGASLQQIIPLSNKALATSGNYRRYYTDENGNKIVHTINPITGLSSPSNLLSATVIAENCALADGYATACMSMGLEKAIEMDKSNKDIVIYLIYSDSEGAMKTYASESLINLLQ